MRVQFYLSLAGKPLWPQDNFDRQTSHVIPGLIRKLLDDSYGGGTAPRPFSRTGPTRLSTSKLASTAVTWDSLFEVRKQLHSLNQIR